MMTHLTSDVLQALEGKTLATAESCTGGMIGQMLTAVPGSSAVYKGGIISYTNEIKRNLLGVEETLLETEGAVSAPVARAMAEGVKKALNADSAASVTGLAGPSGDDRQLGKYKALFTAFMVCQGKVLLICLALVFPAFCIAYKKPAQKVPVFQKLQNPSCTQVGAHPVGTGKGRNGNAFTGGGVDKLVAANIDSHMGNTAATGVEKDEVAFLQAGAGNGCTHGILLLGSTQQRNAVLLKCILGKA